MTKPVTQATRKSNVLRPCRTRQQRHLCFIMSIIERCVCCKESRRCKISLTVSKDLKAPVYVYYELENYYQNHRR